MKWRRSGCSNISREGDDDRCPSQNNELSSPLVGCRCRSTNAMCVDVGRNSRVTKAEGHICDDEMRDDAVSFGIAR